MILKERRIPTKMLIKFQTYSIDVPLYLSVFSSLLKVLLPFFQSTYKELYRIKSANVNLLAHVLELVTDGNW